MTEELSLRDRAKLKELEREVRELRLMNDFLKSDCLLRQGAAVSDKLELIAAEQANVHEQVLSVVLMRRALQVSRSGFYDWARAEPSARAVRRAKITVHAKAAFIMGRGTYGVRRVHAVLTRSGDSEVASVSLDLARTLMQENDLHACQPRAYKVTIISGQAPSPAIADHVRRDFTATAPGARLVGDMTYVRTWGGGSTWPR